MSGSEREGRPMSDVPAQGEPVAWTNEAQLGFLNAPGCAGIPMAMWGKRNDHFADVPLYAARLAEGQPTITDEMHTALAEMHDSMARAREMLADVPGNSLDEALTNYIGSYMALQVEVQELRSRSPAVMETCFDCGVREPC